MVMDEQLNLLEENPPETPTKPLSFSGIHQYQTCPQQYKFSRIDKLPTPPAGPHAQRGTRLHKNIEQFLKGETTTVDPELQGYFGYFQGLKEHDAISEQKWAMTKDWEHVDFDSPNAMVRGVTDIKVIGDELHVMDIKSGKKYDHHSEQLNLYATEALIENPSYKQCIATAIYVDKMDMERIMFHQDMIDNYKYFWEEDIKKIHHDKRFIPTPNYGCRWCPFSNAAGGPCLF